MSVDCLDLFVSLLAIFKKTKSPIKNGKNALHSQDHRDAFGFSTYKFWRKT